MQNRILFCTEKWCDGTPYRGLTNNFHNLFNTFSNYSSDYIFDTLHIDECKNTYSANIDNVLISHCKNFNPSAVIFSFLGGVDYNPSIDALKSLKRNNIKLCFMWPDTQIGIVTSAINELKDVADLSVSWDNPVSNFHNSNIFPNNHISLWVPQDNNLFFEDKQNIDISFVGSTGYQDRKTMLENLLNMRNDVYIAGGQRATRLSPEAYAKIIRSSKICLNFSISPCQQYYQTKGRVYEVLASKSLLMESKNPSTAKLFEPNIDYIEFENSIDLNIKLNYYLSNEDERIKIATNGYKKYYKHYSSNLFWSTVMNRLMK